MWPSEKQIPVVKPATTLNRLPQGMDAFVIITFDKDKNYDMNDVKVIEAYLKQNKMQGVAVGQDMMPVLVRKDNFSNVQNLLRDNNILVIDPKEKVK